MNIIRSLTVVCILMASAVVSMPTANLKSNSEQKIFEASNENATTSFSLINNVINPDKIHEFLQKKLKINVHKLSAGRTNYLTPKTQDNEIQNRSTSGKHIQFDQLEKYIHLPSSHKNNVHETFYHYSNNSEANDFEASDSVIKLLNRLQRNYDRLQEILQNSTSISKDTSNPTNITSRIKRSNFAATQNETDVEYRKYGAYISTKVYQPLGTIETTTKSYLNTENDFTIINIDDQIIPLENFRNATENLHEFGERSFHFDKGNETLNQNSENISKAPKHNDKEIFVKLLDECCNEKINQNTNHGLHQIMLNDTTNPNLNNKSEQSFKAIGLDDLSLNLKPKMSINRYHTKYSDGDNHYERKTSVLTVKQPLENINTEILKSKNGSRDLMFESNVFEINENTTQSNKDVNTSTLDFVTDIQLLTNLNSEDSDISRNKEYKIVEKEVLELAKKLLSENANESPLTSQDLNTAIN